MRTLKGHAYAGGGHQLVGHGLDGLSIVRQLLSAASNGAWFKAISSFTDTAGTIAAGDGDGVGRLEDQSGFGNHATASSNKPVLRKSGNLWHLQFVGASSQKMLANAVAAIPSGTDRPIFTCASYVMYSGVAPYGFGSSLSGTPLLEMFWSSETVAAVHQKRDDAASLKNAMTTSDRSVLGVRTVIDTGTTATLRLNGTPYASVDRDVGAMTFDRFSIGSTIRSGTAGNFMTGRLFEMLILDYIPTTAQIASLEAYMAARIAGTTYAVAGFEPDTVADFVSGSYRASGASASIGDVLTVARTGAAEYADVSDGLISVPENVARVGHYQWNGYDFANAGLLLEVDGATNFGAYSSDLSSWSLTSCSFASGTLTSAAGGFARLTLPDLPDSTDCTWSIDLAPGSLGWAFLFIRNKAGADTSAYVNLNTGAIGTTTGAGSWSAEIRNGRCFAECQFASGTGGTTPFVQVQFATANGSVGASIGDTIQVRRSQVESGDISSSRITTSGSTRARGAEVATVDASYSATGVWGSIEGTEDYVDVGAAGQELLFDWRADANNRITVSLDTDGAETGEITLTVVNGGTSWSVAIDAMSPGYAQPFKCAWRVGPTAINLAVNGVSGTAVTTTGIPNLASVSPTIGGNGTRRLFRSGTGTITDDALEVAGGKPTQESIILLIGQSNMGGRATYDSLGGHPDFTMEWTQAGALAAASIPLSHVSQPVGTMGPDITFAQKYRIAYPKKRLIFVPCAQGSTDFSTGDWQEGGANYNTAVTRALAAKAAVPGSTIDGVLCILGENDAAASMSGATFASEMADMISALRVDLGVPRLPFAISQIGGFLSAGTFPTASEINAAIAALPGSVARIAYAQADDYTTSPDGVHFNAADTRTTGERLFDALASI